MAIGWFTQAALILGTVWLARRSISAMRNAHDKAWMASGSGAIVARVALLALPTSVAALILAIAVGAVGLSGLAGTLVSSGIIVMFVSVCALGLTLPNLTDPLSSARRVPR
jgi:hypothetical protein